jgi:hypothetical protein
MELNVPFPFENRDMIQQTIFNETNNELKVELLNLPDRVPVRKGKVRLPIAEGYWTFEEREPGVLYATLQYLSDPAGSIPSWLVNLFIVDGPLKNIENLREMVQKEKYQ